MGIRVICPNGHRLNLKEHLAGHRGLCPSCGARFRIPFQSSDEPQALDERADPNEPAEIDDHPQVAQSQDPAMPLVAGSTAEPLPNPATEIQPSSQNGSGDLGNSATTGTADGSELFSTAATWYVHVPDGERFGPATSEIMQVWIDEGRVQPNYLVWRDGWSEWQSASTILRQDGTENPLPSVGPDEFEPSTRTGRHKRRRNRQVAVWVILLIFTGLVLLAGVALAFMTGQLSL